MNTSHAKESVNGAWERGESQLLKAALERAAEGWAVHPLFGIVNRYCECSKREQCETPGKHPRLKNYQERATRDPRIIKLMWSQFSRANIGGAPGGKSGINVLDIDPRNGADVSLELLEREHGPLPETVETMTGSGGRHLYFRHDGYDLGNTAGVLGPGLDVRSTSGNVVLPGSRHISGRVYEYEITHSPVDVPLAPMPAWLLSLLQVHHSRGKARPALAPGLIPNGTVHFTFVSWAGTMHHRGLSPGAIVAALLHENATRCDPIRPEANIRKIVADITTRYTPGNVPPAWQIVARQQHSAEEDEAVARAVLARTVGRGER